MSPRQETIAELKTMADRLGSMMVQDCVTDDESTAILKLQDNLVMLTNFMVKQDALDNEASQPDLDVLEEQKKAVDENDGDI